MHQRKIHTEIHYRIDIQNELDRVRDLILKNKQPKLKVDCANEEVASLLLKYAPIPTIPRPAVQEKVFAGQQKFQIQKSNENSLLILRNQNEFKQFGEPELPKEVELQVLIEEIIKARKM